ncbi:hypothetical protein [Nostoc sp. 'Peltigera membranacea cyanobiont' 210A]|uniref:hypothetical protein n=1 Tax=Nostoc sp. 'Peltigera membranacea cyanobiont' 210A TaxID=2014529 RepID=UPI00117E7914|nr:hypothetical protein [Nostoc sp. 'Peltigera membranacea cyanobiont' 210A]
MALSIPFVTLRTAAIASYKNIYITQTGARVIIEISKIKMANGVMLHSPKAMLKPLCKGLSFM